MPKVDTRHFPITDTGCMTQHDDIDPAIRKLARIRVEVMASRGAQSEISASIGDLLLEISVVQLNLDNAKSYLGSLSPKNDARDSAARDVEALMQELQLRELLLEEMRNQHDAFGDRGNNHRRTVEQVTKALSDAHPGIVSAFR